MAPAARTPTPISRVLRCIGGFSKAEAAAVTGHRFTEGAGEDGAMIARRRAARAEGVNLEPGCVVSDHNLDDPSSSWVDIDPSAYHVISVGRRQCRGAVHWQCRQTQDRADSQSAFGVHRRILV